MQTFSMSDKEIFQKENDKLLADVLEHRFFSVWRDYEKVQRDPFLSFSERGSTLNESSALELYITANCNQNCTYCYLTKFGDKLYPADCGNNDFNKILQNMNILIDWCIENDFRIPLVDVFTGEILHTKFGLDVLDTMLKGIKRGWKINSIIWATNMSFIQDSEQKWKIQRLIDAIRYEGVGLTLSASVDGYKAMESASRPLNSGKEKSDNFYDDLFAFCKRNKFGFHPMVSAYNVKWWIENFDWWVEQLDRFDMGPFFSSVMALEVRNNDWTEEAIQQYNDLMDHMMDYQIKRIGLKNVAYEIITDQRNEVKDEGGGYLPWLLVEAVDFTPCTLNKTLTVRLGDLAIAPCHRTSYNHLLYGKFKLENDKIVGIEAINPSMAIKVLMINYQYGMHGCDTCDYNTVCLRGCLGCQQEEMHDPWFPIPGVCHFQKAKYKHLIKKYEELGIIDIIKQINPYQQSYPQAQRILNLYEKVGKD